MERGKTERERKRGREGGRARGEERHGIGADGRLSGDLAERTLTWTQLAHQVVQRISPFPRTFLCIYNIKLHRVTFNNVSDTHISSPLHPYNPALYSPRDQIVGTGAAVKTIDDVGCRVRDGKSAIGAEFSPKVCKRREGEGLRALLILAPDNRFTLLLNTFSPSGHFQTVGTDTTKKELSRRCKMTRVDGQTQGDDERGKMRCMSLSSTSKMSARKITLLPLRPHSLSLLVSLFCNGHFAFLPRSRPLNGFVLNGQREEKRRERGSADRYGGGSGRRREKEARKTRRMDGGAIQREIRRQSPSSSGGEVGMSRLRKTNAIAKPKVAKRRPNLGLMPTSPARPRRPLPIRRGFSV